MAYKISAFADEIGPDLNEQIANLKANEVGNIELRGVWGKNVMALSEKEIRQIKQTASDNGIGFSAVGSPLGKFPLDGDLQEQIEDVKKACEYAAILGAPYIRMFSFFHAEDRTPEESRTQVLDWLGALVKEAEKTDIILAHENEKGIYGDTGDRCLDIYENIKSDSFTGIFDFANYVQCDQDPYDDCWVKVKDHITYFHIKDAKAGSGKVVPAGEGDGKIPEILAEAFGAGFDNFMTLEPHLSVAAHSHGVTTPELFKTASDSLRKVLSGIS